MYFLKLTKFFFLKNQKKTLIINSIESFFHHVNQKNIDKLLFAQFQYFDLFFDIQNLYQIINQKTISGIIITI